MPPPAIPAPAPLYSITTLTGDGAAPHKGNRSKGSNAVSFQVFFAKRFAAFLRENFQSPAHIAICFGVSTRQAENWLAETSAPRGHVVARALTDPQYAESARKHLRVVE